MAPDKSLPPSPAKATVPAAVLAGCLLALAFLAGPFLDEPFLASAWAAPEDWPREAILGAVRPEASARLERRLDGVKRDFEGQIKGVSDQKQISALALKAAGEAWLEAAALLDSPNELFDPTDSVLAFESQWDEAGSSWAAREGRALKFYFEALSRLTARLAVRAADKPAADNLADLLRAARAGQNRPKPTTVQALEAEAKVFWSNRLCALATVLGTLGAKGDQGGQVADLVTDLLNRSEVVASRTDIHYQAKMELLYLNDAQSLTSVLFLMAKGQDSPIAEEAEIMERNWENHLNQTDLQVADRISLTWVANAQLAFPLAWWLATAPDATKQ
ncbi:MAG: hypothetical protein LBJ61_04905 [Deltaproteobacteria bacterium]|jgi:hypothetical protein|nr:hypothetical protein [Deltaproteobacteria bacterium]